MPDPAAVRLVSGNKYVKDAIEKELRDYKEKASKILAMKEKGREKKGEVAFSLNAGLGT